MKFFSLALFATLFLSSNLALALDKKVDCQNTIYTESDHLKKYAWEKGINLVSSKGEAQYVVYANVINRTEYGNFLKKTITRGYVSFTVKDPNNSNNWIQVESKDIEYSNSSLRDSEYKYPKISDVEMSKLITKTLKEVCNKI